MGVLIASLLLENIWNIRIYYAFGKKKQSQNVIAKVCPQAERKALIILGGHMDSAYEFPLMRKLKAKFMVLMAGALCFLFMLPIFAVVKLVLGNFQIILPSFDWSFYFLLLGVPLTLPLYFMISKLPVLGANDNLSAIAVSLNLCAKLKQARPRNVEVWAASFGVEEGGRMGSTAFVLKHKPDLGDSMTVNLETIAGKGRLVIIDKEIVHPYSSKVVTLLREAAQNIGHPLDLNSIPIAGGTGSWSFATRGLHASAITNLSDTKIPEGWHCREDTPAIIDGNKLQLASDICQEFIRIVDEMCQK